MDEFQKVHSRRLIRVCRGIAGVLLLGCFSVGTGLVDVRVYNNEVDYARDTMDKDKPKSHRCNDRLADMLEVIEAEDGNAWRDLRPAFKNWWACMRSAEGAEPAMRYLMLTAKDKQYIEPASRGTRGDAVQQLST